MTMMDAKEHGEYVTGLTEQLLLFAARGPWNDNTMYRGVKQMSDLIAQIDQTRSWAQLSCLYGESLMPPSTYDMFVKQTRIRRERGLSDLAIVILDSDVRLTIRQQLSQAYQTAGIPFHFFASIPEAISWLATKDYSFDQQSAADFFAKHDFTVDKA